MLAARVRLVLAFVAVLAVTAGCGQSPARDQVSGDLTVLAPTSMIDVLPRLQFAFETVHTGAHLRVSYGPDSHQAAQPGDVLLVEGSSALHGAAATTFARNQLVLVVPATNPARVIQLADLARPGLRVARCADTEPCGVATSAMLTAAGLTGASANSAASAASADSADSADSAMKIAASGAAPILVDDVRAARSQVERGTADVAVVYRSDGLTVPDRLATIEVPESAEALTTYQALTRPTLTNPGAAQSFVEFLATAQAQNILTEAGFQLP